jgi:polysaccharide biosynthesis/export protein
MVAKQEKSFHSSCAKLWRNFSIIQSAPITKALAISMLSMVTVAPVRGQIPSSLASEQANSRCSSLKSSAYVLGIGDQVEISGPELTNSAEKPSQVDADGTLQVLLVGRVHVGGLTVQQAEEKLNSLLSMYIREPRVALSVVNVESRPVSVLGAVNTPGVYQVRGKKTLLEVLSQAGGIRPDAGYSARITRQVEWGCIPLPNAQLDASGRFSIASVNLKEITEAQDPGGNIEIFPHDIISVPKAEMVYVVGEVRRSGGFVLGEHQSMSVLQALSLAGGLNTGADSKHAKILRMRSGNSQREELSVNVKAVLTGKKTDVAMQGDDILFIPSSTGKKAALRALEAAVQTGTGLAIWRTP